LAESLVARIVMPLRTIMNEHIQQNAVQRAKNLLQIEGEMTSYELLEKLREYRTEIHPDRFTEDGAKKEAEAKFKEGESLIDELQKQTEVEHARRKPSEMILYKSLHDSLQIQSELANTKKKLGETEKALNEIRDNNLELQKQLEEKKDESLKSEIENLQSLYKPSTREYASISIGIVLTGSLAVMSQMEKVSTVLKSHSPFGEKYIGTILFVCLVAFLFTMMRKLWEQGYIKRKSEEVCSPKCAADFMAYLEKENYLKGPALEFSEVESFQYLAGRTNWRKRFVTRIGFQCFRPETVNRLKNVFIHNLLIKKLIAFSRAEKMQRYFSIESQRKNYEWYHELMMEQQKKRSAASTDQKTERL
jgi:hypothetical protein